MSPPKGGGKKKNSPDLYDIAYDGYIPVDNSTWTYVSYPNNTYTTQTYCMSDLTTTV